jgi:hypothetical protein
MSFLAPREHLACTFNEGWSKILIMETQENNMTFEQFLALPRYINGRIKNLSEIFLDLTSEQVEMLHGDDWSYYHELQEEVEYMMTELVG